MILRQKRLYLPGNRATESSALARHSLSRRGWPSSLFSCLLLLCASVAPAQTQTDCFPSGQAPPGGIPGNATCYAGPLDSKGNITTDANGAYYLIAIPQDWNGTLFVQGHGGPDFTYVGSSKVLFSALFGAGVLLPRGYAVAATSFARQGWTQSANALDIESLRRIFVNKFGRPKQTFVIGGSYSGGVVSKVVENFGVNADGTKNYDGAAIGCGLLGGICHYFDAFLDLRVVYQYYCQNFPLPSETQYPLYFGYPLGINRADITDPMEVLHRASSCTGFDLPAAQRSAQQSQNLANIQKILRIPDDVLAAQFANLTLPGGFALGDFTQVDLSGRNAISNLEIHYTGSTDDDALNKGVARYAADRLATAWVDGDSAPVGNIHNTPVLTFHGESDPIVFVETESVWKDAVQSSHQLDSLLQLFVKERASDPTSPYRGHCGFTPSETTTTFDLIINWAKTGAKPTVADAQRICNSYLARSTAPHDDCRFDSNYTPRPWSSCV